MLKDKVMLITGASRGIGRATALLAAKNHSDIIINYNTSKNEAKELVHEISEIGSNVIMIKSNVSNEAEVKDMFRIVKREFGKLDVLVNNAGIMKSSLMLMTRPADVHELIDVNIKGSFFCTQRAAKMMLQQKKGKIINLSSIVGRFGTTGLSVYSATKAAIIGLTKSSAKELGNFGITVNAVAPGVIDTDMTKKLDENLKSTLINNTALKRIGSPLDVAKVIIFLSSDLSDYVSGQIIGVDGCQMM